MLKVLFLAVLQGVAEFLPVSSSGHLVIGQRLVGLEAPGVRLEICLHAGTLVSIFVFYRATIARLLGGCFMPGAAPSARRESWAFAGKIVASAIPAVAVYVLFKSQIDGMMENARMTGALLMFTGAVLAGTRYLPRGGGDVTPWRAVLMGMGQAVALLPGVSRSGMTLASARAGRVDPAKSAEFSFLMSAPLILGGVLLELLKELRGAAETGGDAVGWGALALGTAVSAAVGYWSLKLLVRSLKGRWFWLFGPYCFAAGLAVVVFMK